MITLLPNDQTGLLFYSFAIQLEGQPYTFTFRWNERASAWFMAILDNAGNPLLCGRKVVIGWPLLARFVIPALPPGELMAIDTTGEGVEAGVGDLGGRVLLYYVDTATLGGPRFPGAGATV